MRTISEIRRLRQIVTDWRLQGLRVVLVPTMGNLHRGHLHLVEHAQSLASKVVTRVFIKPMQFDNKDDLAAYPRTLEDDRDKLEALGTDLMFAPDLTEIYPRGFEHTTRVEVPELSDILCGANRPGHFHGVATVVTKLFNMVQPDVAVFGEKDYQQLLIIRRMTADLNLPIEVVGVATVRESDGLAMSSRNGYLSQDERRRAPILYRTLTETAERVQHGDRDYPMLERYAAHQLERFGLKPEYISLRRQQDLGTPAAGDNDLVILCAAWLGKARLIDNITFSLKQTD